MIVVCDTSCVSNLMAIGRADLLTLLFGDTLIPPAVRNELLRFHGSIPSWLQEKPPTDIEYVERLRQELDLGEAEGIALAKALGADRLLVDESLGRTVARREGLQIMGVVGVLIASKQRGLIPAIRPLFHELREMAGFWIADEVIEAAASKVNEEDETGFPYPGKNPVYQDSNLRKPSMFKSRTLSPAHSLLLGSWSLTFLWILALGACSFHASAQDLPSGFSAETVASGINAATALTIAPDGRVFFAEQTGALRLFKDDRVLPEPALDIGDRLDNYWERGLIGVTLHPDFPLTPHLFVVYVAKEPFTHHVVSRFTVTGDKVDPASEMVLLKGDDQSTMGGFKPSGHQGGPIRVGPDGKLYIGLGEQTSSQPSQKLDTLIGKILRINLDGSIPEDNPFYNKTEGKYRAIWAYGIRNPFGLVFESGNNRLWHTDVGQTSWEEINIITNGGNYGWPDAEGMSDNPDFINPVHMYPPAIGRSIVGGMFYPASEPAGSLYQFPEKWQGKFFFGDWANHWIKALDPNDPERATTFARNFNGPVALEPAPDGSIYVLNRGTIWRDPKQFVSKSGSLVRIRYVGADAEITTAQTEPIPNQLKDTGLITSFKSLTMRKDLVEFTLNSPPWQPGVSTRQWITVPNGGKIKFTEDGEWEFPTDTIVMQLFTLDGGERDGSLFESRVMWFNGPRTVRAGAYRWSADGSSASLIEDGEFTTLSGQEKRNWFTPGAEQNLNLDQVVTGFILPLNTRQANRDGQLEVWNRNGWFSPALTNIDQLPKLASIDDASASIDLRVRSYMDANCSVCHRPGGSSRGEFDARFSTPISEQGLIAGRLIAGDLGIEGAGIVMPGHPDKSILLQRVSRTDFYRMPPVAFSDDLSPLIRLLEEWIMSMPDSKQAKN